MTEFNSINDWTVVQNELSMAIGNISNTIHFIQLGKMRRNLRARVTELSKAEVDMRRTGASYVYLEKLAQIRKEISELYQWITFATLVDN